MPRLVPCLGVRHPTSHHVPAAVAAGRLQHKFAAPLRFPFVADAVITVRSQQRWSFKTNCVLGT